eukprot:Phypoly_transcript_05973.p1 GENE.Phypoly_transcript_05973~~Phypoly_transcript_05973.p1  ORF type:complete len:519 (+),score=101.85 Phypoly_transcript_05973:83-1639(+)
MDYDTLLADWNLSKVSDDEIKGLDQAKKREVLACYHSIIDQIRALNVLSKNYESAIAAEKQELEKLIAKLQTELPGAEPESIGMHTDDMPVDENFFAGAPETKEFETQTMLEYLTDQGLLKQDRDWFVDDQSVGDKSGFFTVAGLLSGDERCVGLNLSLIRKCASSVSHVHAKSESGNHSFGSAFFCRQGNETDSDANFGFTNFHGIPTPSTSSRWESGRTQHPERRIVMENSYSKMQEGDQDKLDHMCVFIRGAHPTQFDFSELARGGADVRENPPRLRVGTRCFAIGHPLGGHQRVSVGQVTHDLPHSFGHSCKTFAGSSGCPIFSLDGQVLGIHHHDGRAMKISKLFDHVEQKLNTVQDAHFAAAEKILQAIAKQDHTQAYHLQQAPVIFTPDMPHAKCLWIQGHKFYEDEEDYHEISAKKIVSEKILWPFSFCALPRYAAGSSEALRAGIEASLALLQHISRIHFVGRVNVTLFRANDQKWEVDGRQLPVVFALLTGKHNVLGCYCVTQALQAL